MIIASAVKVIPINSDYPIIVTGLRHADCYEKLHDMKIDYNRHQIQEGFMTDKNQMVNRIKAKQIAYECGQIKDTDDCPALYSEDIWPEQYKNNPIEYVKLIKDICVDYDGFNTVQGLKSLIDEIGHYARLALKGMTKD